MRLAGYCTDLLQTKYRVALTTVALAVPCTVRGRQPRASRGLRGPAGAAKPKFYRYRRPPYIADSLADDFKETPWR